MFLLVFSICFAFILSAGFLYRYGNIPRQHPLVSLSVLVAWSFSFLIVFTIPLDITAVSELWWHHRSLSIIPRSHSADCLPPMSFRAQRDRHQLHWVLSTALGHGVRRRFPESLAHHLLDVAVPHVAHHAAHAVVFESRGLQHAGQAPLGAHRQRDVLRNLSLHLRVPADLHRAQARRDSRLAEAEGHRFLRVQHVGIVPAGSSARLR